MQEKHSLIFGGSKPLKLLPPPVPMIANGVVAPWGLDSSFTLAKIPYLMLPLERDIVEVPYLKRLTVEQATAGVRADLERLGYTRLVVSQNGYRLSDLNIPVSPGDFLAVSVYIGEDMARIIGTIALMVVAVAAGQLWAAGLASTLGTSVAVANSIIGMVVMIGGGMILNTFLPAPTPSLPQTPNDKPTYSFDSFRNIVKAGLPLPVVYGHIASAPTVIGSYRWVDMAPKDGSFWLAGDNNSMWVFFLLACAVGEAVIPISKDDVLIGDEDLTAWSSFDFGSTSGSRSISDATRSALEKFRKIHHDRSIDKVLEAKTGTSAFPELMRLHFHPGPDIDNDAARVAGEWTVAGNVAADSSIVNVKSCSLHFPADGDFISTDDLELMRLPGDFQIDCEVYYTDVTGNSGICGQQVISGSGATARLYRWSLCYVDGSLHFQAYKGIGETNTVWTMTCHAYGEISLRPSYWHYIRVQKKSEQVQLLMGIVGRGTYTLVGTAYGYIDYPSMPDGYEFDAMDYADLPASLKAMYSQQIGKAYFLSGGTVTELGGRFYLEEMRICRDLADAMDVRTLPSGPLATPVTWVQTGYSVTTISECDGASILIEFPQGLFAIDSSGNYTNATVQCTVSYRKLGTTTWTESQFSITAMKTVAVRYMKWLDFPERAQYEIQLVRNTPNDTTDSKKRTISYWTGVDEQINIFQAYPGIQVVSLGVRASDKASGQLQAIRVKQNRTEITVPGWGGAGTQVVDPRNPMWAAYDMMTSKIYGRGINSSRFNQPAWEAWRDWCAGDVAGETRCQCNGVFDEIGNLRDNGLNHIEQIGRARVIPYGATWTVIVDKPRSPQYCFSAGNIHPDSFQWEGYEENEKVDAIEVTFLDRDRGFKKNSVMAKASWFETLNRPPKTASIELRFCNNKPQAIREAILRMQKTEKITRHGRLTCGIEAAQCEFGDVVHIIHPGNIYAFGGRAARDHSNASQVYLDQYITMPEADFGGGKLFFFVVDPDGVEHQYPVTGPWNVSTRRIDIAGSYTGNRFDTFGMGRPNREKLLYQIMNMSINPDDQSVEIEFVEYVDSVYFHPNYGGGLIPI